jgi:hypothetical protein
MAIRRPLLSHPQARCIIDAKLRGSGADGLAPNPIALDHLLFDPAFSFVRVPFRVMMWGWACVTNWCGRLTL